MVDNISTFTGLDLAGISARRNGSVYNFNCPECGNESVAGRFYSHCSNKECGLYIASAVDLLAQTLFSGDYVKASEHIVDRIPKKKDQIKPLILSKQRDVLTWWMSLKAKTDTTLKSGMISWCKRNGLTVDTQDFGVTVVDHKDIKSLKKLAATTGGAVAEGMFVNPGAFVAYAVQTLPNKIDRIIIQNKRGVEYSCTWNAQERGVISLADARPDSGALLYSDLRQMLLGKSEVGRSGNNLLSCAVWIQTNRSRSADPDRIWMPDGQGKILAVIRNLRNALRFTEIYHHLEDVDNFHSVTKHYTMGITQAEGISTWTSMRVRVAYATLKGDDIYPNGNAQNIIELLSLNRDEGSSLIAKIRKSGRFKLANNLHKHLNNTILFQSNKVLVKASTNDYQIVRDNMAEQVANFCLEMRETVFLRESTHHYYSATLIFDKTSIPVTITKSALEDPRKLEDELRSLFIRNRKPNKDGTIDSQYLPVVTDPASMKRYVVPYLKKQTATLKTVEGVDQLGWVQNDTCFVAPGRILTMDGVIESKSRYKPFVEIFSHMDKQLHWDSLQILPVHPVAQDLIAMILSNVVRCRLGNSARPIAVRYSDTTRRLLRGMFQAIGQQREFDLENNMKHQRGVEGIKGYPLLCKNFNIHQVRSASFPHVVLCESGYSSDAPITDEDIHQASRTFQHALSRVIDWCLADCASGFSERRGFTYNSVLLKEGKWIMENVCEQQSWEVTNLGLEGMEKLMQQVQFEDTPKLLELHNGQTLVMHTSDLEMDVDQIATDLDTLEVTHEFKDERLCMSASTILPALQEYYGERPKPKLVLKTV